MIVVEIQFGTGDAAAINAVFSGVTDVVVSGTDYNTVTCYFSEQETVDFMPSLLAKLHNTKLIKSLVIAPLDPNASGLVDLLKKIKRGQSVPGVAIHRETLKCVPLEDAIHAAGGTVLSSNR